MTHITGVEPSQILLFPEAADDYVSADNLARFLDAFVDELDLAAVGFARVAPKAAGRPGHAPSDLLKPHIYGYLNRVWSGHQLEPECNRNSEIIRLLAEKVAQIQDPAIAHPQIRKFFELTRKAAQSPLNLPIKDALEAFISYDQKRSAFDSTDDWRVMLSEELIHHAKCIRVDAKHGNADAYEPSLLHAEKIIREIYSAPQMLDAADET